MNPAGVARPQVSGPVTFKPVLVPTSGQTVTGRLVFAGDLMVAVLVPAMQELGRGSWIVEAGFGPWSAHRGRRFSSLQEVAVWAHSPSQVAKTA
jgi:hypothetical protein